jgi:hypothetical protein
MFSTCPKCGRTQKAAAGVNPEICSGCGLVFAKWVQRQSGLEPVRENASVDEEDIAEGSLASRLWNRILHVPERTDPVLFWGRAALYIAFFVWGWYFILLDFRTAEIGHSFMHRINLVFHEAGHIVFMPFGDFMMTGGGSLGQLLMPLIVMVAFIWQNRDSFAASLGLWWFGQSLMDLAPYINDARDLQLMLLGGGTGQDRPGIHDWENILLDLRLIEYDRQIAWGADALGTVLVLTALCWGACILYLQYRKLSEE